jgi:hypothetical protein
MNRLRFKEDPGLVDKVTSPTYEAGLLSHLPDPKLRAIALVRCSLVISCKASDTPRRRPRMLLIIAEVPSNEKDIYSNAQYSIVTSR